MGRTSNNAGAQVPATPADAIAPEAGVMPPQKGTAPPPAGTPPDNGNTGVPVSTDSGQTGATPAPAEGTAPPPAETGNPPAGGPEPEVKDPASAPEGSNQEGRVKVKHEILKGKKLTLPSGEIAAFDENGILETDKETAEYLLSIPGYEKG